VKNGNRAKWSFLSGRLKGSTALLGKGVKKVWRFGKGDRLFAFCLGSQTRNRKIGSTTSKRGKKRNDLSRPIKKKGGGVTLLLLGKRKPGKILLSFEILFGGLSMGPKKKLTRRGWKGQRCKKLLAPYGGKGGGLFQNFLKKERGTHRRAKNVSNIGRLRRRREGKEGDGDCERGASS